MGAGALVAIEGPFPERRDDYAIIPRRYTAGVPAPTTTVWVLAAACALQLPAAAVVRRSPRAQAALKLAGATVAIDYGRPALRGRAAFGALVPWGEVWRAGDDEATVLATDTPLRFGGLLLAPGRYALFVRPDATGATLIFNREPDQWGAFNRNPALDVGSVPLQASSIAAPIERFSLALEPVEAEAGRLWLGWENTVWMAPFTVVAAAAAPATP